MGFLVTYYIDTALLVGVYILWALYMAAQHSAPLRSGEHTMMGGFISFVMVLVYIFYIHNVVGGGVCCMGVIYGGAM